MARVTELPDDYDETTAPPPAPPNAADADMNVGSQLAAGETPFGIKPGAAEAAAERAAADPTMHTAPELPPGMASVRSYTADEIADMLNRTPLFMNDVDAAMAGEENAAVEAIRALQHEGTRADAAQGLRENGNELARARRWAEARDCYTQAVGVVLGAGDNKWQQNEDPEKDRQRERETLEASYTNRALCNLELKNYRTTTLDCAAALKLNPRNIKAWYRCATALLRVDRLAEARDACERGLAVDAANAPLDKTAAAIAARQQTLDAAEMRRRDEEARRRRVALTLAAALRAREIRERATSAPPQLEDDARVRLEPDPLSPTSSLVFPVVFLYPLEAQSDFIKAVGETDTLGQHLNYMLPPPWDSAGQYRPAAVDCYMETATGGLVKVGKKLSLLRILAGGRVEVVDGLVTVNVVPMRRAAAWISEARARLTGGGR